MGALFRGGDAILVEIVAEDIDAVGAGQVVEGFFEAGDGMRGGALREVRPTAVTTIAAVSVYTVTSVTAKECN